MSRRHRTVSGESSAPTLIGVAAEDRAGCRSGTPERSINIGRCGLRDRDQPMICSPVRFTCAITSANSCDSPGDNRVPGPLRSQPAGVAVTFPAPSVLSRELTSIRA